MKKAFTITELLVAVSLLVVVLSACGIIFNYSIDSQRTAGATAEIMRNLRAITDQLNADFAGYVGPGILNTPGGAGVNADEIEFITTGDFQTADVYGTTTDKEPVRGNIARIYYGQANDSDLITAGDEYGRKKILTRKVTIIAPGDNVAVNDCVNTGGINGSECDSNSLIAIQKKKQTDLENDGWLDRPTIDVNSNPDSIRMYLARGVDDFKIEYLDPPFVDTAGKLIWESPDPLSGNIITLAFRFTFTLYDSKGIIKTGRRFEHIVYIGK